MTCDKQVLKKIISGSCRKYSIFGFRFGPMVSVKIEVIYHSCGKFSAKLIEGPEIKNFEKVFHKEIDRLQKDIVKDLTFAIRRKQILEQHTTKKIQKIDKDNIHKSLNKAAFDELTIRMRESKVAREHTCLLKKPTVVVSDEEIREEAFDKYFGDTTKIVNRKTKI